MRPAIRSHGWLLGFGIALFTLCLLIGPGEAGVLDATWTAPTTNTDGSPLTDLGSYRVYYGTTSTPCPGSSFMQVTSPTPGPGTNQTVSSRLSGLATGTLYTVAVTALDTSGNESTCSSAASAVAQISYGVSPTGSVGFGNVTIGSVANQTFTVSNTRGGTVSGTATTSAPFTIVSGGSFTLVGLGATQSVTVRFTPTTATTASVNVNFAAAGDSVSRLVSGTGVSVPDTTAPTGTITTPTSNPTWTTTGSSLTLGGTAADNIGVTQVTWANNRGGSGTATGTTSWTASGVGLQLGTNVLTVTVQDAAGNRGTGILTVTRTDGTPPTVSITAPTSNPTLSTSTSALTLGGTASDNVAVTQVTWANNRGGSGTATGTTSWVASGVVLQSGSNVLIVTARDAAGNMSTVTLTVMLTGNFTFTDDPLAAYSTPIKAVHLTELRTAIDRARAARGLASFSWTDPTLSPGSTRIRAIHLTELRTALNQAYQAAGRSLPTYTDPIIVAGPTFIRAIHLSELRAALRAL